MLTLSNVTILPIPSQASHVHYQSHVHVVMFPVEAGTEWAVHLWRN